MPRIKVQDLHAPAKLDLDKLPKRRKDWLEVFQLPAVQPRVMQGTCEYCIWGTGAHALGCVTGIPVGEPVSIPRPPRYEDRIA